MNNNNQKIVDELNKLVTQLKFDIDNKGLISDKFRLKQMLFLINVIKKQEKEILAGEDLKGIKGIGEGSIIRINEILAMGKLDEIVIDIEGKKYLKQIEELEQVYGIGRKTAYNFVKNKKIKSVEQLKEMHEKGKISLPYHIVLGLKYHNVYKEMIPREEIIKIDKYLKKIGKQIDPDIELIICGSYRRGKPFSNDIDVLIVNKNIKTKKDIESKENYLKKVVAALHNENFLLDDIDKDFIVKYMGFCKFKQGLVRRIDLMYVPYNNLGSALLHFTGSGDFNKRIRETAINLGFSLSQYGLVNKVTKKMVPTITEKDVFDKLSLEYIEPTKRDF
jgi:DNA polymerase beta